MIGLHLLTSSGVTSACRHHSLHVCSFRGVCLKLSPLSLIIEFCHVWTLGRGIVPAHCDSTGAPPLKATRSLALPTPPPSIASTDSRAAWHVTAYDCRHIALSPDVCLPCHWSQITSASWLYARSTCHAPGMYHASSRRDRSFSSLLPPTSLPSWSSSLCSRSHTIAAVKWAHDGRSSFASVKPPSKMVPLNAHAPRENSVTVPLRALVLRGGDVLRASAMCGVCLCNVARCMHPWVRRERAQKVRDRLVCDRCGWERSE